MITLFIIVKAQNATDLNTPIPMDPNVRTGKLPNNMTYYIMKNKKPEHRAEFRLAVNVGSTQENDNQQGLAHFTEHMAFNGTKHFAKNDLIDYIESIGSKFGADLNAYTSFDETVYMLQIPTDSMKIIDKTFQILEDWSHDLTEDSIEIDKERGVVIEEWRLGQGANERMRRQYWPVLFKDSRYAVRLPIGKKDIIANCSYETLRSFYREWYRPENMAIVIVGEIDVDQMEAKIKEQFAHVPLRPHANKLQSFPVPDTKGISIAKATDKEATFNLIQLIYKQPKFIEKTLGDYRKDLAIDMFNEMMNARLSELKQQADAPFTVGFSNYGGLVRTEDAYSCRAIVKDGGIEKGIEALATENQRVKKYGFTSSEMTRTKADMMRKMEKQYNERDKTESRNLVGEFVANYLQQEPVPGVSFEYDFYKKYLDGITLEEVNELAKKWITDDNAMVIITAPEKAGVTLPTDDKIMSILKDVQSKDIKPYQDMVSNKPLLSVKPSPGKVTDEKVSNDMGITKWKLSNGAIVILKPTDFKNDEILMSAYSFGGTSLYSDKDYLSASNSASVVDAAGLGEFNSVELQKLLTGKIANVSPFINDWEQGFNGSCSPRDLETMMQMLYLYITNPNKNQNDFKAYIEQQRSFLQNRSSSPDAAFQDTIKATMAQYNYRSLPMTEDNLKQIDLDRAVEIYKERFHDAGSFTFVFVGNFKPETLKPFVEMYIASLPSKNSQDTYKDLGISPPKGKVEKTVLKGVEPKSSVSIKLTGPFVFNRKNRNDLNLLMQLVSIKLREQLREEKSGVYGVRATPAMNHYPKQSFEITIGFGCAPENVDMLIKTAWEEIDKIKQNGCDDKDLLKLKETALRERETYLKDNRFWLSAITQNALNGENLSELLEFNKYVESLKSDDFKRLANQYFTKENIAKFVMNPVK